MRTVVEFPEFIKKADKLFGSEQRETIVEILSNTPNAGKRLENFGGIRRLEWTQHGKRPKEHNIYYHPGAKGLPVLIIGIFGNHEKQVLDKIIEILLHSKSKLLSNNF